MCAWVPPALSYILKTSSVLSPAKTALVICNFLKSFTNFVIAFSSSVGKGVSGIFFYYFLVISSKHIVYLEHIHPPLVSPSAPHNSQHPPSWHLHTYVQMVLGSQTSTPALLPHPLSMFPLFPFFPQLPRTLLCCCLESPPSLKISSFSLRVPFLVW